MKKDKIIYFVLSFTVLALLAVNFNARQRPHEKPVIKMIDETEISEISFTDTADTSEEWSDTAETVFPLNLNTATKEELMKINGIGDAISDRIIEYRERNGDFTSVEQLIEVEGIGEKKLSKFSPFLYVE